MTVDKKPWRKPELIVLVRGRPEEAVLAGCKGPGDTGPTGNALNNCHPGRKACFAMNNS